MNFLQINSFVQGQDFTKTTFSMGPHPFSFFAHNFFLKIGKLEKNRIHHWIPQTFLHLIEISF